jgi:hypothetical protein
MVPVDEPHVQRRHSTRRKERVECESPEGKRVKRDVIVSRVGQ